MDNHYLRIKARRTAKAPFFFFIVVLLLTVALAFKMIASYLVDLVTGGILALLTKPVYDYLCRRHVGRKTAAIIVTVLSILLVVIPILGFTILASKQAIAIVAWMSQSGNFSVHDKIAYIADWAPFQFLMGDTEDIVQKLRSVIEAGIATVTAAALVFSKGIPGGFLQIALTCLALFFFLIDGRRLLRWTVEKLPFDAEFRDRIALTFIGPIVVAVVITLLQIRPILGRRFGLEFSVNQGVIMSKEIMPTEREKEIAQKQVEREKEIAQKQVERDAVIDSWETDGGSTNGGPTINALKQKESASTGKERLTAFRLKLVGFFRSIGAFIGQHKSQPRH